MASVLTRFISYKLVRLNRITKQFLLLGVDAFALFSAAWIAYCLRFGILYVPNIKQFFFMWLAPLLAIPVFIKMGLYRSVIRYLGEKALWAILKAMTIASLLWAAFAFLFQFTDASGVPRTVPILYALNGMVLIAGTRFWGRWFLWSSLRHRYRDRQVLIYGTDEAGRQLAASLRAGGELLPIGFIAEDWRLQGKDIDGLRVYSPENMPYLFQHFAIRDLIAALPLSPRLQSTEFSELLRQYQVQLRVLPSVSDIASGKHLVSKIREIDIVDVLGRAQVAPIPNLLTQCITSKVVLVTGAGGSIGSELCRQIARLSPSRLVLLEASEHGLYQIERALKEHCALNINACLGSIRDKALLERIINHYGVETIYHAAAHKHVPIVEANPIQGIENNVLGTLCLTEIAFEQGVDTFVLISSDKAVRPTNVMGATKRWSELIVQHFAQQAKALGTRQRFSAVRFGNVLGSSGSVMPLFKEQITQGGPVTVTHEEVTRYFMSIQEAVELVIQAGSMASGGEIFLLHMGEPVKVLDLAKKMIHLAGRSIRDGDHPQGEIEIHVTGLRPGEKLYEELLISDDNAQETPHSKIMKALEPELPATYLTSRLAQLQAFLAQGEEYPARQLLMELALNTKSA